MNLLKIEADSSGKVLSRPNRFLVEFVDEAGSVQLAHLHDPGRLPELIYPGNRLLLKSALGVRRKTKWDVLAANSPAGWVFIHSGFHRRLAERLLENGVLADGFTHYKAEVLRGNSRLDFLIAYGSERRLWVEVKGCTLSKDGVALFPDAPTERGRRHILELIEVLREGDDALVVFLVFRQDAKVFSPNEETDPVFSDVLKRAHALGVSVRALKVSYNGSWLSYLGDLPVNL